MTGRFTIFFLMFIFCFSLYSQNIDIDIDIDVRKSAFIDRLVESGDYDRAYLDLMMDQIEIKQTILDAISRPAERVLTWNDYRNIFVTEQRVNEGLTFFDEHKILLKEVTDTYGVPIEIILSILGVETYFGNRMGSYRVIDALGTLAFAYPPRANFFATELEQYLSLINNEGIDFNETLGSYAGAMGAGQFIPSSYNAYAVDGDGDGVRDLWSSWPDIFSSIANYFEKNGWNEGGIIAIKLDRDLSVWTDQEHSNTVNLNYTISDIRALGYITPAEYPGNMSVTLLHLDGPNGKEYWAGLENFRAITRYNISVLYGMAIYELSEIYRSQVY
jgi:membrane-bound lytic murein transglycosylase B